MAQALYRKYRPRTFAEVIGQEHVTAPLMQALRSGRLHHAYLFSGPRGCGKTSSARILARSLNCERGPTPEPCGECGSCVALAPDGPGSIDVIEIDAASHGGVDDARDLRERAVFAPVSSRFKVYVIDEAHMVSSAGFNALLKLVEEPPDYVKFVFATTEPEKVLGTIKSRTHHYPFRLIPPGVLRPYLEQLAASEQIIVDPAVFPLVVRAGGGSARDSLSVLDQLIAGAGSAGVTYAGAAALLGVTDVALIDEMCDALAAGDGAATYAAIDRVAEAGHDPRRFASDLLERFRDLIILRQVPDAAAKGLIDAPDDELSRMADQSQRFGLATLSRLADIVHNGLTEMRGTTGPRLLLELICARMLLPGADDSTGALLHRLERMERRLAGMPDEAPMPTSSTPGPNHGPAAGRASEVGRASDSSQAANAPQAPKPDSAPGLSRAPDSGSGVHRPAPAAVSPESGDSAPAGHSLADPSVGGTAPGGRPAPSGAIDGAAVRRVWSDILGYVKRKSPRAAAMAHDANPRDVTGDVLVLLFQNSFHANAVTKSPNLLIEAVAELLGAPPGGGDWQIQCEVAGALPSGAAPGTGPTALPRPVTSAAGSTSRGAREPSRRAPSGVVTGSGVVTSPDDGSWPETARPGGGTAPGGTPTESGPATSSASGGKIASEDETVSAGAAPIGRGRSNAPGPAGDPRPRSSPAKPVSSADVGQAPGVPATQDTPVTQGTPGQSASHHAAPAHGSTHADVAASDVDPSGYAGFDPGDEPLDGVVDAQIARQTSEEQALRLLREKLDTEKIGEIELA